MYFTSISPNRKEEKWQTGEEECLSLVYVYKTSFEQFQVSSRLNYWFFVAVLTIALPEQNWKTFFVALQLFSNFDKMLVFRNKLLF